MYGRWMLFMHRTTCTQPNIMSTETWMHFSCVVVRRCTQVIYLHSCNKFHWLYWRENSLPFLKFKYLSFCTWCWKVKLVSNNRIWYTLPQSVDHMAFHFQAKRAPAFGFWRLNFYTFPTCVGTYLQHRSFTSR